METKRETKLKLLRRAHKLIAASEQSFVCLAIMEAATHHRLDMDAQHELCDLIDERLGKHVTLEQWLAGVHRISRERTCSVVGRVMCRETRLAWIESLILEHGGRL